MEKNEVKDISNLKINTNIPQNERILKYIKEVENPYNFKVGDILVKVEYDNKGKNLQSVVEDYLKNICSNYH